MTPIHGVLPQTKWQLLVQTLSYHVLRTHRSIRLYFAYKLFLS